MVCRTIAVRLLFVSLCVSVAFGPRITTGQDQTESRQRPTIASIDAALQPFVESGQISGAVTLVAHDGKIVHLGAIGLADIESKKEMGVGQLFSIASMTKPITATALMILQDEGKLNVNDKVSKYLPDFKDLKLQDG